MTDPTAGVTPEETSGLTPDTTDTTVLVGAYGFMSETQPNEVPPAVYIGLGVALLGMGQHFFERGLTLAFGDGVQRITRGVRRHRDVIDTAPETVPELQGEASADAVPTSDSD